MSPVPARESPGHEVLWGVRRTACRNLSVLAALPADWADERFGNSVVPMSVWISSSIGAGCGATASLVEGSTGEESFLSSSPLKSEGALALLAEGARAPRLEDGFAPSGSVQPISANKGLPSRSGIIRLVRRPR